MLACSEFHVRFKYRSTVYRCPGKGSWFYEISEIALLDAFSGEWMSNWILPDEGQIMDVREGILPTSDAYRTYVVH